jgi:hypothetical protein
MFGCAKLDLLRAHLVGEGCFIDERPKNSLGVIF